MATDQPILPPEIESGFRRFRRTRYADERDRYRRLGTEGQRPTTLVVACSDSRAAPETVFDARPGELFVIRNIAALIPVYEPDGHSHGASAALEYAVRALGVRHVVVLGHGRCGGVAAALGDGGSLGATDFVGAWVRGLGDLAEGMDPADAADPDRRRHVAELRAIQRSLANLRTFPWVREGERRGSLELHGAWFDIALGELDALTPTGWAPVA